MRRIPGKTTMGSKLIGPVLALLFLMTLVAMFLASTAEARVIVRGQVRVPGGRVVVKAGSDHGRIWRVPARQRVPAQRLDNKIARRLANRTRFHKVVFLDLRQAGYSWRQIGNILQIPRRLMRQAIQPVVREYGHGHDWTWYWDHQQQVSYRYRY